MLGLCSSGGVGGEIRTMFASGEDQSMSWPLMKFEVEYQVWGLSDARAVGPPKSG